MDAPNNQARRATISVAGDDKSSTRGFISARRGSTLFRQDKKTRVDEENSISLSDSPLIKSLQLQKPCQLSPTSPSAFDLMHESPSTSKGNATGLTLSEDKKRKIASTIFGSPRDGSDSSCSTADSRAMSLHETEKTESTFEGFSIIKNRMSSSGRMSGASPNNMSSLISRRNDSIGAAGTPHSPQKYHTPMSNPVNADKVRLQMALVKEQLAARERELVEARAEVGVLRARVVESDARCTMAVEEVNAASFVSSLQEQKIEELETNMSRDRMEFNEALSQKSRKHKSAVKKLNQERAEYEQRADQMIQQMQEQMGQLQVMAMTRIEVLERELMAQRHTNDKLQSECTRLRSAVTSAQASAAKQRQLTAGLSMSSPPSGGKYFARSNNTPRREGSKTSTPCKDSDTRKGRSSSTGSTGTSTGRSSTGTVVHEEEVTGDENEAQDANENDNDSPDIAAEDDMWQACI
ncbi:hypothetical protein B484DRAFT_400309 [Ochromonadaceae sp. CCMP2298]|nr:hypothetical protein B484DRAFT_400309 [Ochromonadaceae sp. CCMP2298]